MKMKSLQFFGLTLFAALALTACGGSKEAAKPAEATVAGAPAPVKLTGEVNVFNWVEYIPEKYVDNFTKEVGVKVNYDTFETDEALNAKLIELNPNFQSSVENTFFFTFLRQWHF